MDGTLVIASSSTDCSPSFGLRGAGSFLFFGDALLVVSFGKFCVGTSFGLSLRPHELTKWSLQTLVLLFSDRLLLPILWIHARKIGLSFNGRQWYDRSVSRSERLLQPGTQQITFGISSLCNLHP